MKGKLTILIGEAKKYLADIILESFGSEFNFIWVKTETEVYENLDKADAVVVGLDVCPLDQDKRLSFIRKIRSMSSKTLVVLTSVQYSSVRIALIKTGADDVLTKPFNPEELVVRTKRIMGILR